MLIHKIFHLREPVTEARRHLREVQTWSGPENGGEARCSAIDPDGTGHFEFAPRHDGQSVSADIREVPDADPNRILFRSVGGNVRLAGMIELFPIRPALTEVVLTVDYEAASPLQKAFGTAATALDRFLNRQLSRIESCINRARTTNGPSHLSGKFA
jgi:hypothetical protein